MNCKKLSTLLHHVIFLPVDLHVLCVFVFRIPCSSFPLADLPWIYKVYSCTKLIIQLRTCNVPFKIPFSFHLSKAPLHIFYGTHGCHIQRYSLMFPWLFPDKCKFPGPTEEITSQISPDNTLNPSLKAIPSTHIFMFSASHVQCIWIELTIMYKKDWSSWKPNSILWTIFYQYNIIHVRTMYKWIWNVGKH